MIIDLLKKYCFLCVTIIGFITYLPLLPENTFIPLETQTVSFESTISFQQPFSSSNFRYGACTTHTMSKTYNWSSCYPDYLQAYYASLLPTDFERAFENAPDDDDILNNYPLYAFPHFLSFARTLPSYENHILSLCDSIKHDKKFRTQTALIPYFEYNFFLWYENSGFHTFVNDEAQRLTNARNQLANQMIQQQNVLVIVEKRGALQLHSSECLHVLANNCTEKINSMPLGNNRERLLERIDAINQTCSNNRKSFDYSSHVAHLHCDDPDEKAFQNRYGTQLDCHLHKELSQTRSTMRNLEYAYCNDSYVQNLAPVVYRYTLQAKIEQSPLVAFELSDFCYTITQVLSHGMHVLYDTTSAIGRGVWKGVNDFASIEHWQNMATGVMQLGLLFVDEINQEYALHHAMFLHETSNNQDLFTQAAQKYCDHKQAQKNAMRLCAQETYKKIKAMSWEEIIENGAEVGTTMILDTLALNALSHVGSTAGNFAIKQLNSAMESGVLLTEQYAVEVAGFGKLIIEEGAEATVNAMSNPEVKSITQAIQKSSGKIMQERGKAFEELLVQKLGGKGSFKIKGREFDGAVGNIWYEAKSGGYWDMLLSSRSKFDTFTSTTGEQLKIAALHGAIFEVHSNVLIPKKIKDWLIKMKISFVEWV